jgi:exonuclease III
MKLISLNIELNRHYETVFDLIKKEKPDVICLQELLEEDFERFKKEFGMDGVFKVFQYVNDHRFGDIYDKRHGVAIFSKKIEDFGYFFYEGKEENIMKSFEEYLVSAEFHKNEVLVWAYIKDEKGAVYRFTTTHFPVTEKGESTPYQLEVADKLLAKLADIGEFVLCGDMNAPRGNETFSRFAKTYKDNIPLEYKTSLDQNLHRVKGLQYMVDSLFTTPGYKAENVKLVDGVSDHMAIVADINLS